MANKFVDFSATNDGDGTTAAQASSGGGVGAYNTLVGKTFTAGDKVWLRRNTTLTLGAVLSLTTAGIEYIGWPIITDEDYSSRPQSGIDTGWDSDSGSTYPTIATTNVSYYTSVLTATTQTFKRIKFDGNFNSGSDGYALKSSGSSLMHTYKYCTFVAVNAGSGLVRAAEFSSSVMVTCNACSFSATGTTAFAISMVSAPYVNLFDCTASTSGTNSSTNVAALNIGASSYINAVRCTFTGTTTSTNIPAKVLVVASSPVAALFIDCEFDNSSSGSGTPVYTIAPVKCEFHNCIVKGSGIDLTVATSGHAYMHFKKIEQTIAMTDGAIKSSTTYYAFLVAENFIAVSGNTNADITCNYALIVLRSATFQHSTTKVTGAKFPGVYISDIGSVNDAFYHYGARGTVESAAVSRSGGSSWAYKFCYNDSTAPVFTPLLIGIPGLEELWVDLVEGENTITVYGAHKGWSTAPTKSDIWFDTSYMVHDYDTLREGASSNADGVALTSDASSWSGDTGLTAFKMVITVTAAQACSAPIRLRMKKYDATACIYIDPAAVVS